MASPYEKMLEDALGAYQRQRERLTDVKEKMDSLTSTATSARREVTATVGRTGELTELSFPTSAYKRMAPAELASVIVRTISEARQASIAASAEELAPMLPPGFSAQDMMSGKVDVRALIAARVPGLDEGNRT
ncbi:YbaB/EbfC family nucleoid-associated protein [Amycolatopsis sp. NBC_01480]|uniref:YbaB/EbfC family nucleoid-associated protein n=1 Tax=Amycolatopsis sp. NBC_01480 TaxID=2903562 RepID=UPI002E2E224F|nr:YbaB/EbfC family nucleoid-associated protein [Amycolatopsis sp. NBC_01480]